MYKLCKWIYQLGYERGKFDGRNEMVDKHNFEKAMGMYERHND